MQILRFILLCSIAMITSGGDEAMREGGPEIPGNFEGRRHRPTPGAAKVDHKGRVQGTAEGTREGLGDDGREGVWSGERLPGHSAPLIVPTMAGAGGSGAGLAPRIVPPNPFAAQTRWSNPRAPDYTPLIIPPLGHFQTPAPSLDVRTSSGASALPLEDQDEEADYRMGRQVAGLALGSADDESTDGGIQERADGRGFKGLMSVGSSHRPAEGGREHHYQSPDFTGRNSTRFAGKRSSLGEGDRGPEITESSMPHEQKGRKHIRPETHAGRWLAGARKGRQAGLPKAPDDHLYPAAADDYGIGLPEEQLSEDESGPTRWGMRGQESAWGDNLEVGEGSCSPAAEEGEGEGEPGEESPGVATTGLLYAATAEQDALQRRAVELVHALEIDEAIATWKRSVAVHPASGAAVALAAANIGGLQILLGNKAAARRQLSRALVADPTHPVALWQEGHYLECCQGDHMAALRMYEKAAAAAPHSPVPLYAQGRLRLARLHDHVAARGLYARALELDPTNVRVALDAAQLELVAGNLGAARKLATGALKHNPQHPHALLLLSKVLFMHTQLPHVHTEPKAFAASAMASPRDTPRLRSNESKRGWSLDWGRGAPVEQEWEYALSLARRAKQLAPADALVLAGVGHVLLSAGRGEG